jgi:hypothetical protein
LELQNTSIWPPLSVFGARFQTAAGSRYVQGFGAALLFLLTTGALYFVFSSCDCIERQYDDAYITFRYAHNLATGKGLVFNPGDPTDSASSFLYTIVLAAIELLGFRNLPRVAAILGIGAAGVVAAVVYLATLERTRRPLLSFGLSLIVTLHGLVSRWAVSGMETLFYSTLVLIAVYRLFVRRAYGWAEALLTLAVLLTRYEGVLLAGAWALVGAIHFARSKRARRVDLLKYAAAVSGGFGVFLLLKLAMYGSVIPHAFALKTITTLYAPNPTALWSVWRQDALGWLVLALVGLITLPRSIESFPLLVYVAVSVISLVRGPFADYARYSVHMLPIAAVLASVPLSRLSQRYMPVTLAVLGVLAYDSYSSLLGSRESIRAGAGHEKCRTEVGQYLERSLPAGTLVLSSDIGVIAYAAPSIRFIDAVGLTSKEVLYARMDGRNVDDVLFKQRPVYIADTCGGKCTRAREFAAYSWLANEAYWRTPLPRQHYTSRLVHGKLLHSCRSADDLNFATAKFTLK